MQGLPLTPSSPSHRYHTIHRMSGRRKLPQIPGAAAGPSSNSSRVTTPQETQDSPRDYLGDERGGGMTTTAATTTDEGSREPEGRSQNSSPATSLVREATLDQWPREKGSLDPWEQEDLKGVLRDLNTTRDQLLALQNLVSSVLRSCAFSSFFFLGFHFLKLFLVSVSSFSNTKTFR